MTREEAIKELKDFKDESWDGMPEEVIDIAIEVLEQEPCEDAISRQAVLDYIVNVPGELTADGRGMIRRRTLEEYVSDTLLPVIPQPKIGHWIRHDTGHSIYYDCSRCGCVAPCTETADKWLWRLSNYCPDCGAKMENYSRVEVKK